MVISGDFKIELVEANSKIAFKEHTQNDETYVEVEPEAEYFVSFQRVALNTHKVPVKATFSVDGNDIGISYVTTSKKTDDTPIFYGLYKRQNGEAFKKALRFVRPKILDGNSAANTSPMIGRINVHIYERIILQEKANRTDTTTKMETEKVLGLGHLSGAKFVRSAVGDTEISAVNMTKKKSRTGNLLQTINLYYCTVPGLMQVGIIEKPKDIYEEYKIFNPNKRPLPTPSHLKVEPQRKKICRVLRDDNDGDTLLDESYQITYDLSQLPSSDDDDDDDDEYDDEFDVQSESIAENNAVVITPQKE